MNKRKLVSRISEEGECEFMKALKKVKPRVIAILIIVTFVVTFVGYISHNIISADSVSDKGKGLFVPIIMYHSILADPSKQGEYIVSPIVLENDIIYLKEHGYQTVFVSDLIDYVYSGKSLPKKPVILTFDDGNYNNYTYVQDLLRKHDCCATVSVVGTYTEKEQGAERSPSYSYLTFDEIVLMRKSGLFEIANHSYNMHTLGERKGALRKSNESYELYRSEFLSDLLTGQSLFNDKCGFKPLVYTYPFGLIEKDTTKFVRGCGFLASMGVEEKPNYITDNPECLFCLNRYNRPSGISTDAFMNKALRQD